MTKKILFAIGYMCFILYLTFLIGIFSKQESLSLITPILTKPKSDDW